ncbi:MAG: hypothetical protein KDK78_07740, partial [Chlamydiia bacterium]|nr:hypothetical protein [Chlamydiia bacterium]
FKWLETRDLGRATMTCRRFSLIGKDAKLWVQTYFQMFSTGPQCLSGDTYYYDCVTFYSNLHWMVAHPERRNWERLVGPPKGLKILDLSCLAFLEEQEATPILSKLIARCSELEFLSLKGVQWGAGTWLVALTGFLRQNPHLKRLEFCDSSLSRDVLDKVVRSFGPEQLSGLKILPEPDWMG